MIDLDDVDEYKDWSLRMKIELKREQLWDIVEGIDEPLEDDPTFMAKNEKALRVIKCDCLHEFYDAIRHICLAKIVWDTFAAICTLPKSKFHRYLYISL